MLADDPLHDHQPQAGAFLLGREERLKDLVDLLLWNAAAGVRHADPDTFARHAGREGQPPVAGHRVHRVLDQVHQHLLDLRGIDWRLRQVSGELLFHIEAAIVQLRLEQG